MTNICSGRRSPRASRTKGNSKVAPRCRGWGQPPHLPTQIHAWRYAPIGTAVECSEEERGRGILSGRLQASSVSYRPCHTITSTSIVRRSRQQCQSYKTHFSRPSQACPCGRSRRPRAARRACALPGNHHNPGPQPPKAFCCLSLQNQGDSYSLPSKRGYSAAQVSGAIHAGHQENP